jgi:hypothetical protein
LRRPSRERTLRTSCQRVVFSDRGSIGTTKWRWRFDQGSSQPPTSPKWRTWLSPPWTNVPDNLAVDSARDAVLQLEVHLGNRVLREHRSVRDITWRQHLSAEIGPGARWCGGRVRQCSAIRTDSRRLDHVADGEPLDGLVLGGASRAVGAPNGLDVAAACEKMPVSKRAWYIAIEEKPNAHPSCCGRCSFSS